MDDFEARNKMMDELQEFIVLMDQPDFDPADTPEHAEMMLNLMMFRLNKSAYSLNPWKFLKFFLFRNRYLKRMSTDDPKSIEFMLNILMIVVRRTDYVVPLVWHDIMIEVFNEKENNDPT